MRIGIRIPFTKVTAHFRFSVFLEDVFEPPNEKEIAEILKEYGIAKDYTKKGR